MHTERNNAKKQRKIGKIGMGLAAAGMITAAGVEKYQHTTDSDKNDTTLQGAMASTVHQEQKQPIRQHDTQKDQKATIDKKVATIGALFTVAAQEVRENRQETVARTIMDRYPVFSVYQNSMDQWIIKMADINDVSVVSHSDGSVTLQVPLSERVINRTFRNVKECVDFLQPLAELAREFEESNKQNTEVVNKYSVTKDVSKNVLAFATDAEGTEVENQTADIRNEMLEYLLGQ